MQCTFCHNLTARQIINGFQTIKVVIHMSIRLDSVCHTGVTKGTKFQPVCLNRFLILSLPWFWATALKSINGYVYNVSFSAYISDTFLVSSILDTPINSYQTTRLSRDWCKWNLNPVGSRIRLIRPSINTTHHQTCHNGIHVSLDQIT